ncbi:MAG TPA: lysophospholipid acyltransferase family protein [Patescibacteria group bacterium]|nr:lysophospholipid acyltransferase family protein [Patescibacteria group bacterium]
MEKPPTLPRRFFFSFIRLFILIFLGMNVRRADLLPRQGPAIVIANHNSHLDTLVLLSLFPPALLPRLRPIAAADYFLKTKAMAWFASRLIGIIPMERGRASKTYDPLQPCCDALDRGDIIILFPEGSRGEPEKLSQFKKGIAHLAERYPHVPITPVFLHGLGKALPKDDFVLVPFFCDVFIGAPLTYGADRNSFMDTLNREFQALAAEGHFAAWE